VEERAGFALSCTTGINEKKGREAKETCHLPEALLMGGGRRRRIEDQISKQKI
jgi:hypothetical protein